jgi:hypothetical protein
LTNPVTQASLTRATTVLTFAEALSCRAFCLLHMYAAAGLNSPAVVLLILRSPSPGHNGVVGIRIGTASGGWREVLSARPSDLAVIRARDLGWSDLGEPERALSLLRLKGRACERGDL